MGTWTLGADNATIRNVPGAGPGLDPGAAADSAAEPHQRHPLRRQVDLPRRHVQGSSAAWPTSVAFNVSYTLSHVEGRCVEPRRDRIGSQRAAERAQHLRRDRGMGAVELRSPASVHRQRRRISCRSSLARAGSLTAACSAAGAPTPSSSRRAARRSPSTSASIAPTSAPGRPSAPISCAIRTCPAASARRSAGSTPAAFALAGAVHLRQRAAQQRARARATPTSTSRWPRPGRSAARSTARVPLGGLQPVQPRQLRPAEPDLRQRRTSAGSSARRIRARCSSGCGWRSERRGHLPPNR